MAASPAIPTRKLRGTLLAFALCLLVAGCASWRPRPKIQRKGQTFVELCPQLVYVLRGSGFRLAENEQLLTCGRPSAPFEEWRRVPALQTEQFLRTYLERQGFFAPTIETEDGKFFVSPGARTKVALTGIDGEPAGFRLDRYRKLKNEPLASTTLDGAEAWARERLGETGYPCAKIKSGAWIAEREAHLQVTPGPAARIPDDIPVRFDTPVSFDPRVLLRYRAFVPGQPYDARLLRLTERRITQDGIVLSNYFETSCEADPPTVAHVVTPGEARLIVVGVGFSTEDFFRAKIDWTSTRLGRTASDLRATATASFKQQLLRLSGNYYPSIERERFSLQPTLSVERESRKFYEDVETSLTTLANLTRDTAGVAWRFAAGPGIKRAQRFRGIGAPYANNYLSAEGRVELRSHGHEYYADDPREGYRLTATLASSLKTFASRQSFDARRLQVSGDALWNVMNLEPTLAVIGVRWNVGATFTPSYLGLPKEFLHYLGGSDSLRGYDRGALPGDRFVALRSAYLGFESRFHVWVVEPIVFWDVGALGGPRGPVVRMPLYSSFGSGLRWKSPIGPVRATFARGWEFAQRPSPPGRWQFFISLGEEF
jgi:translocation and assembly module TamA